MNALEMQNVSFSYSDKLAVNNVTLTVKQGEFVCLLGRNGSGKSTIAKLINGLLTPKDGVVKVFGLDSKEQANLFEIRKRAGMVFQNPDNQMVASIVEDDIAFGPENIGVPREQIKERIDYALSSVNMEKYIHSTPTRLSGGQKQRIAIAGILALKPDILILDESTSMLDPEGRDEVMNVVRKLNADGMTVIDITHYMDEAIGADRVIIVSDGQIVKEGTPKEIFSSAELLEKYGLCLPKAAYIAQKLRKNGVPISEDVFTKEELSEALCELFQKA